MAEQRKIEKLDFERKKAQMEYEMREKKIKDMEQE